MKKTSAGNREAHWWPTVAARMIVFAVLYKGLTDGCNWLVGAVPLGFTIAGSWSSYAGDVVSTLCVVVALALVRRVGDRDVVWRSWFARRGAVRQMLIGLGLMAAVGLMIIPPFYMAGLYTVTGPPRPPFPWWSLSDAALIALSEEVVFRGYLFRMIEAHAGSRWALLVSCVLFGLCHLPAPAPSLSARLAYTLNAAIGGLMLGAAYLLTRRLWLPMALHLMKNFSSDLFLGSGLNLERQWLVIKHPVAEIAGLAYLIHQVLVIALAIIFLNLAARRQAARKPPDKVTA